jgi:hypothetical protein
MMNEDSKKRLKAIAEAVAKLMKEQDEQKARETAEAEDDDMDLGCRYADGGGKSYRRCCRSACTGLFSVERQDIEADSCFPCCVVEVYCDDEL